MNRRLLKSTYFLEEQDIYFTNGLPPGWSASSVGASTTYGTKDNSDAFGSHFFASPRGSGSSVTLKGTGIGNNAKIVEMDIEDLHINLGDTQFLFGLLSSDYNYFCDMNIVANGQVDLLQQNGNGSNRSTQIIHKVDSNGVGVSAQNVDAGIVVDTIQKKTKGHFEHSFVEVSGNYPVGQILIPTIRIFLLNPTSTPNTKVRRIKVSIYS